VLPVLTIITLEVVAGVFGIDVSVA
jgi:hypothetical protein